MCMGFCKFSIKIASHYVVNHNIYGVIPAGRVKTNSNILAVCQQKERQYLTVIQNGTIQWSKLLWS